MVNSDTRAESDLSEAVSVTVMAVTDVLVGTHRATTVPVTRTVVIIARFVRAKNLS